MVQTQRHATDRCIEPSQAQIPKDEVLEELETRHNATKSEIEQLDKELEEVQVLACS